MRIRLIDFRPLTLGAAFALAGSTLLAGCGNDGQQAAATAAPPPPSVVAVPASRRDIAEQAEFVGRVTAINRVDLQARVPGFMKEWHFTEGQRVTVGDALFQIEPEQYQAVVDQRQADLAMAEANAENAVAQFNRGQELLKNKTIAQSQVDELKAKAAVARASIAQAKAALTAAELDLSYTRVTAPVAGRLGLARYTVGNLVGPDSGPLATIVSGDPIYVDFPLTQRQLLEAKRDLKAKGTDASGVVVSLRLPDGSLYDQNGRINFVDVTTNQSTDSVTVRAEIANPDGTLVDAQYVGVLLQAGAPESAIVVPQSALQLDQQGTFVLIVDADSKAQVRRVQTGPIRGADIVVNGGLKEGELVIAAGVQKVRPGQVVSATPPQAVKPDGQMTQDTAPTEGAASQ